MAEDQYPDEIGRIMSPEQQAKLWAEGKPLHNGASRSQGECLPDFGCCCPELLWPLEKRKAFIEASEEEQHRMMGASLGAMLQSKGHEVIER